MHGNIKSSLAAATARAAVTVALLFPVAVYAGDDRDAQRHPYEGFTQPYRSIRVAASDTGRVVEVLIRRGDIVGKGQLLLKLDTSILEAARKVAQSEAEATARINALQVEYELKQRRLEQFQALHDSGHGSAEELWRAQADERVALFNLQVAEEEQRKQKLELDEIEARIRGRQVTSPIDGIVIDVAREVGEFVSMNDPEVATVVDLHKLRASFFLPTRQALGIGRGQSIKLTLVEMNSTVTGTVEYVDATTQANSGRVRMDVVIDNAGGKHRSGLRCLLDDDSITARRELHAIPERR